VSGAGRRAPGLDYPPAKIKCQITPVTVPGGRPLSGWPATPREVTMYIGGGVLLLIIIILLLVYLL